MASYPSSIPTFVTPGANLSTPPHSAQHVAVNAEVIAICNTLGEDPQGSSATVKLRLEAIEASIGTTGHAQNTDLGTTNATFYINGISGPYLKGSGANLQIRNHTDTGYVNVTAQDVNVQGNITNGVNSATVADVVTAVTDMHTHANKSTLDTYNQSNSDLTSAVSSRHTQNTDSGTTSATFQLASGSSGAKAKSNSGVFEIRNAADSGYADIRAADFRGYLQADNSDASRPTIKYDEATNVWQLSNDGTIFTDIAAGLSLSGSAGYVQFAGATNLDSDSDFSYDSGTQVLSVPTLDITVGGITSVAAYTGEDNMMIYRDTADAYTIRDTKLSSNYSQLGIGLNVAGGYAYIQCKKNASGTELPLTFWSNAAERMRIATTGIVKLNYYTTNGFVKFTGTNGTLDVDSTAYVSTLTTSTPTNLTGFIKGNGSVLSADNSSYLNLDQTTPQTVINGKPTVQGFQFNTNPTVGTFSEGKLYYDKDWHTLSLDCGRDATLQMGEEEWRRVYNNTGSTIYNGQAVYTTGSYVSAVPYVATVALAQANAASTSQALGIATQDIPTANYGFITVRGHVNGLNTDVAGWNNGDVLYLSESAAGGLTNAIPVAPNLVVRMGRLIYKHASAGVINIRLLPFTRLGDLGDVSLTSPTTDNVLKYNGATWVNGTVGSVSAGPGIEFFNCTPTINTRTSPTGLSQDGTAGNGIQILSLSKTPVTTTEQSQVGTASSDTRAYVAWLYDTALGRTVIDAGLWDFTTYALVSSTAGTTTSIRRAIYQVVPGTGTLDFTGSDANSRTATISAAQYQGTYFAASATNTVASYIQATSGTDKGVYQITAMTDGGKKIATVTTRTGYTNETGVTYNIWNLLFIAPSFTITSTSLLTYDASISQPAFTISATDKLGQIGFVTSTGTRSVTVYYNGTAHSTHFSTPLVTLHNNLAGLDGGTSGQYYHLTSAEYAGTGIGTGNIARLTSPQFTTPNLGTPSAGTLSSCSGLPVSGITASTSTALGVGSIELGHASDTTIARVSAGVASIESNNIITANMQATALAATAAGDKNKYLHSNSSSGAMEWLAAGAEGTRGTFVTGDLSTGVLTITHNKALATPYTLNLTIADNNQIQIIPDAVTFLANTITVDLTSYGTLTGTWGYYYI